MRKLFATSIVMAGLVALPAAAQTAPDPNAGRGTGDTASQSTDPNRGDMGRTTTSRDNDRDRGHDFNLGWLGLLGLAGLAGLRRRDHDHARVVDNRTTGTNRV
jgi:MYXO-CTERM domain-containing protein